MSPVFMSSFPLSHFCLQRPSQRLSDLRHFPFLLCIWVTCFRAHLSLRWVGCPLFPSLFPSASAWPAVYFLLSVFPPCSTVSGSCDGTFWWYVWAECTFLRPAIFTSFCWEEPRAGTFQMTLVSWWQAHQPSPLPSSWILSMGSSQSRILFPGCYSNKL